MLMFTALESPQGVPFGYVAICTMVKVSYRSDLNKWHIYIQMDQALSLHLNYMISIGHTCIHTYIFQTDQIMKYHDKIGVIEHCLSNPLMYLNVCLVWLFGHPMICLICSNAKSGLAAPCIALGNSK